MTILYTLKDNSYADICEFADSFHALHQKFYINLTNRCPCSCTFCLRQTKQMLENNSLWLKEEPSVEEVINELDKYNLSDVPEIIFCGFGEPTERIDDVATIATYIKKKYPSIDLRINTNGLGNLIHKRDIAPQLTAFTTVSISLNASTKEEFLRLTRSSFGIDSFEAMKSFAVACKAYVPNVVMSVVDIIGEDEIAACQKICNELGVTLRVREYEE